MCSSFPFPFNDSTLASAWKWFLVWDAAINGRKVSLTERSSGRDEPQSVRCCCCCREKKRLCHSPPRLTWPCLTTVGWIVPQKLGAVNHGLKWKIILWVFPLLKSKNFDVFIPLRNFKGKRNLKRLFVLLINQKILLLHENKKRE